MRQVHGDRVAVIDADTPHGSEIRGVDALVTTDPGRVLVVLAADCLPILIAGDGCVAAVHAGWRGLAVDIVGRTVEIMVGLGAEPSRLRTAIGPSIRACCYEVGSDVADVLATIEPTAITRPAAVTRPHADLVAVATRRFTDAGAPDPTVVDACTGCGPGAWYSHRRDPAAGRQAGLVRLGMR